MDNASDEQSGPVSATPAADTALIALCQIARHLGCAEELAGLEARFAAGELDTRGFAAAIHSLWRSLTEPTVAKVFGACPWLGGISEVCADIRERSERSARPET